MPIADTIQINKNEERRKFAQCRTKPIRLNAFSSEFFDETTKWYNLNNDEQHALGESMRTMFYFSWFDSKLIWHIHITNSEHTHTYVGYARGLNIHAIVHKMYAIFGGVT